MKIIFLITFGYGVKITPEIGLVLMTPKTHRQTDIQTEFINRVKSEYISLRTKLVISFN